MVRTLESLPLMQPLHTGWEDYRALVACGLPGGQAAIALLPWRDWDRFESLAEEDGGVDSEGLALWQSFPGGETYSIDQLLEKWIDPCRRHPVICTKGGLHCIRYDIHLWVRPYQLVFNPEKELLMIKRHGILGWWLGSVLQTPWCSDGE